MGSIEVPEAAAQGRIVRTFRQFRIVFWVRGGVVCCALAAAALTHVACPTPAPGRVGTATCLACHDGRSASDQRAYLDSPHKAIDCEACHGPGAAHVRNGGRGGLLIDNPGRRSFAQAHLFCGDCHDDITADFDQTAHFKSGRATCTDCHNVHAPGAMTVALSGTPAQDIPAFGQLCGTCHSSQYDQFLQSGHAVSGVATCASCHNVHRAAPFTQSPTDNRLCLQCHGSAFLGFDSEAAIDAHTGAFHPVDPVGSGSSRCTACHMPPLDRMRQADGPHDHTLFTIPPLASNEAAEMGIDPVPPNSCSGTIGCHDANVPGSGLPFDVDNPLDNVALQTFYESIGGIPQ